MFLLTITSTLRTIALLLIAWWILRMFLRARNTGAYRRSEGPQRPRGDVRIENAPRANGRDRDAGIIDAEFEEIK